MINCFKAENNIWFTHHKAQHSICQARVYPSWGTTCMPQTVLYLASQTHTPKPIARQGTGGHHLLSPPPHHMLAHTYSTCKYTMPSWRFVFVHLAIIIIKRGRPIPLGKNMHFCQKEMAWNLWKSKFYFLWAYYCNADILKGTKMAAGFAICISKKGSCITLMSQFNQNKLLSINWRNDYHAIN